MWKRPCTSDPFNKSQNTALLDIERVSELISTSLKAHIYVNFRLVFLTRSGCIATLTLSQYPFLVKAKSNNFLVF